ncbi:MAG TPA: hypothetical protein VGP76_03365 [Planctomycetaceae bacterium]|jgi:hypothetical protein|nr:hypothetical protein [Planctomycetaceae bacterium]
MTNPLATCTDIICETVFGPYHLAKLWIYALFFGCVMVFAFWCEPWLMLSLAGVGFSICHLLSWLAAPKKAPSSEAIRATARKLQNPIA